LRFNPFLPGSGPHLYLGYCVNILPIRINLSDDPNLGLLIKRVHNLTRDIITHSAFPFSDLINKFQPPRLVNQIPFFNTVFIYHNNHLNNENNISAFAINKQDMLGKFAALAVSTEALPPDTIPTDINLTVTAVQTNFICSFEYNSVKFAKTYINRLANKYINLVEKLSAAIDTPISQFSYSPALLTDQQLQRRIKFNATQKHYAGAKRLDTLFHESAKTYPDHLAIATAQYQLSYSELQTQVNRLSNYLLGLNYSREWPIAIIIDKSWQQIAACLGIVSAGFAYLPIDPNLPIDRIYELIKISRVELALTQGDLLEKLTQHAAVKTIKLLALDTAFKHELLLQPVTQPETNFADTDLAYIIFTSGSTGIPKGVMIEHCSAVNTIKDINQRFQVTHKDKLLGLSYLNFDLSVYDIFGIFAAGATLILPDESNIKNPAHWVALIEQYQITLWDSVPMFLQMLIEHLAGNKATSTLLSLRLALLSGDWIPLHLWEKLRSYHSFKAVSLGGATECSIWSNFYEMNEPLPDWKSIPYGSPLANQQLYVYDKLLNHCPDGVIGDLYIAGEGLARGYWQDTLKTNASFLYHPVTKQRIYKTGDLARYRDCDLIEFIGREDNQIKLNGYRVELNEIQLILKNHHAIKDALLLHYNKNNKNMLVAYVIVDPAQTELASGDEEKTNKIIHYLSMHLQNYKIPTSYIYLTAFPLSVNGKVSKDLLPAPEFNKSLADQDAILKNDLQLKLAEIWRNLLNIDIQHMHDNFFKLGGNSLLAVRLANQIKEVFQVEIDVINIFHNQTIEQLAKVISALPKNQITIPLRALPRVISKAKTSATIS
jgi:pyochelin synthetase